MLCLFVFSTSICIFFFFFFNDTATTEIYTLSLHDALPICHRNQRRGPEKHLVRVLRDDVFLYQQLDSIGDRLDRKSTRLNSSHGYISYAVFCLKKKKIKNIHTSTYVNDMQRASDKP